MTIWIIEPRDPLLVRDGRPFGADPGARATSLPFPFPSTIASGLRTRAGLNDQGIFQYTKNDEAELNHLKKLCVRGPLLVQLTDDGGDIVPGKWLIPAPADAQLFPCPTDNTEGQSAYVQQLVPLDVPQGAQTDMSEQELLFVGRLTSDEEGKLMKNPPAYWYWNAFETWLLNPSTLARQEKSVSQLGLQGLIREHRLHVSIEADKEIGKDGMLFETSGLEFTVPGAGEHRLKEAQRLALAVATDDSNYSIRAGLTRFGGERRIVTWRKSSAELPLCPAELERAIITSRSCRVLLLTPACFEKGYRPVWFSTEAARHGITAELKAITVQRPQVVSGWDFAQNKPKPSRRLAPAGTVLYFSLQGNDAAINKWIKDTWMECISDDEQDRRDGFGLAVLGTWSGRPLAMGKEADR